MRIIFALSWIRDSTSNFGIGFVPNSSLSQVVLFWGSRSARVRPWYRPYLHKAIVFSLLRTHLPRMWRGCHSEFQNSPQSSLTSAADQYSSLSPSAFLPSFSLFLDFKPPCNKQAPISCLRYLACIPAYYYTGLRLHISFVTLAHLFQIKSYSRGYFILWICRRAKYFTTVDELRKYFFLISQTISNVFS